MQYNTAEVRWPTVNIFELHRKLNDLKRLREGHSRWEVEVNPAKTKQELIETLTRLKRDLGALDLGVVWSEELGCYVVYDLDSVEKEN